MENILNKQIWVIERALEKLKRYAATQPVAKPEPLSAREKRLRREVRHELLARNPEFSDTDIWSDSVAQWLQNPTSRNGTALRSQGRECGLPGRDGRRIYSDEILVHGLGFEPGEAEHDHKIRIGKIMYMLRWRQRRESAHRNKDGTRARRQMFWIPPI